jgi:hypothetical protein
VIASTIDVNIELKKQKLEMNIFLKESVFLD